MSLEEELVALSLVLADQREHIKELEQLIRDFDALLDGHFPYTWNEGREGILLQERMRELGIKREGAQHE
jgi:hypothetical protein